MVMDRQEANRRIIKRLKEMVEKYPTMRFHQLLINVNIEDYPYEKDKFYEESASTLGSMRDL